MLNLGDYDARIWKKCENEGAFSVGPNAVNSLPPVAKKAPVRFLYRKRPSAATDRSHINRRWRSSELGVLNCHNVFHCSETNLKASVAVNVTPVCRRAQAYDAFFSVKVHRCIHLI